MTERVYEFDRLCDLLSAVYRLAWREAREGNVGAIHFLDHTVPTWREWERRRQQRQEREAAMQWDNEHPMWEDTIFEGDEWAFTSKGSIEKDSQKKGKGKKNGKQTQTTSERRQLRAVEYHG